MAATNWITEDYIKKNSIITDAADVKILISSIDWCQDYYIKKLLGSNLWNEINDEIDDESVSANNQTLLDEWILKALLQYVLYHATPDFLFKYMNKGILTPTADGYSAATLEQIQYLKNNILSKAEWYHHEAIRFLIANNSTYPKYSVQVDDNAVLPQSNAFKSGLFLEDENNFNVGDSPFRR